MQIHAKLIRLMAYAHAEDWSFYREYFAYNWMCYECVDVWKCPFLYRWGLVAMLCTWRYCTCPGLCRNEEMEATYILTHMLIGKLLDWNVFCSCLMNLYGGGFKVVNCNIAWVLLNLCQMVFLSLFYFKCTSACIRVDFNYLQRHIVNFWKVMPSVNMKPT